MKLKHLLTTTALALAITAVGPAWAEDDIEAKDSVQTEQSAQAESQAKTQAETRAQAEDSVTAETDTQLAEKRAALIEEATQALDETRNAIAAIEKGDIDAAVGALAVATGKLATVVARDPDLALAPVGVDYLSYDVLGPVQAVRDIGNRVEDLVDDGEFQAARKLLRNFGSEIVIQTTNLPLATYPDAILEATALLDDGKTDEALSVLNTALSTLVLTETVIPLPPLRAEAMIDAARALLEDGAKADESGLTASDYVESARQELEIAEALGYGREKDFEDLHEALDELDDKIEAQEDTAGILDKITERFKELRERVFN